MSHQDTQFHSPNGRPARFIDRFRRQPASLGRW
jgi:hypothetical protein